jgi:hypothetical protein
MTGNFQGRVGMDLSDTSSVKNALTHVEQLQLSWRGNSALWGAYRLQLGGVMHGNGAQETFNIFPEYNIATRYKFWKNVNIDVYSDWHVLNPLTIKPDELVGRQRISGFKVNTTLPWNIHVSLGLGYRTTTGEYQKYAGLANDIALSKHFAKNTLRFWMHNISDIVDSNVVMPSRWGLDGRGEIYGVKWSSRHGNYTYSGKHFVQSSHFLEKDLTPKIKSRGEINLYDFEQKSVFFHRLSMNWTNRMTVSKNITAITLLARDRVTEQDSLDRIHWRKYAIGLAWNIGKVNQFNGEFIMGYKQSASYGHGLDITYNEDAKWNIMQSKSMKMSLKDVFFAELFSRMDIPNQSMMYDMDHHLEFVTEFRPQQKFSIQNRIFVQNHFGSDLNFSYDTLRNHVTDQLAFKMTGQSLQSFSSFSTIMDMDSSDVSFRVDSRLYLKTSSTTSLRFWGGYRFGSSIYDDLGQASALFRFSYPRWTWAAEWLYFGYPALDQPKESQLWFRFTRRL